ncbi:hypothetical protein WM46_02760 [Citrobacter freundii complex sp. CFNIH2]|jgi:hypothetical protein|nr:hypothetical protein WM46_02760 [Citrobacter freundii complex sp. CFNIH2]
MQWREGISHVFTLLIALKITIKFLPGIIKYGKKLFRKYRRMNGGNRFCQHQVIPKNRPIYRLILILKTENSRLVTLPAITLAVTILPALMMEAKIYYVGSRFING